MALSVSLAEGLEALSDKCVFPQSALSAALNVHSPLPHPLIYSLESESGKSILVGVKEFTAPEGEILVPEAVYSRLEGGAVRFELAEIPKAAFLRVRPSQFYPHITNWKYYLESFLSKNYTTLSKNQDFGVYDAAAKTDVKLTVEDANDDLVVVVDTDIALDVVPLNDIMAAQQLSHNNSIAYLENIPDLLWDTEIALVPFNQTDVPSIHRVDLRSIKDNSLSIELKTDGDPYNADLLVGLDKFVTLENFAWCTMAQDSARSKRIDIDLKSDVIVNYLHKHADDKNCWLYVVPFAWEHACLVVLTLLKTVEAPAIDNSKITPEQHLGQVRCDNCRKYIDKNKFQLHEAFCVRNNVRCSCGEIFTKSIPSTHWHCEVCVPQVHGNSSLFKFKHEKLFHMGPYVCGQCNDDTHYEDFISMVENHKATTCPAKLHECVFCHLILPQEEATYVDKFANLTHHENACGNKTTECTECGKVVKTKDLPSHLRIHFMNKVESASEHVPRCTNRNCVNIFINGAEPTNELGLCESCFGSLYAQVHDPTHIKLQNRLERKYIIQLTKGCNNAWCENPMCATHSKWDMMLALKHIQLELLPQIVKPLLPLNAQRQQSGNSQSLNASSNSMWFCVNASIDSRRRLYEKILAQDHYGEGMVLKAVAACPTEPEARHWLKIHSI